MLRNQRLLFILPSFYQADEICDFLDQTALELAKKHPVVVVLYGEGRSIWELLKKRLKVGREFKFIRVRRRVCYLTPIYLLPWRRFAVIHRLNLFVFFLLLTAGSLLWGIKKQWQLRRYVWIFTPRHMQTVEIVRTMGYRIIYDIIDLHTDPVIDIQKYEKRILDVSDVVVANTRTLADYYRNVCNGRLVRQVAIGFRLPMFIKQAVSTVTLPKDKPVIGFVGHLNERLDVELLKKVIQMNPGWRFVFVGPIDHDLNISTTIEADRFRLLFDSKNVTYVQQLPRKQIAGVIAQFDVGMIPYDQRFEFNRMCMPMKTLEYFYMGKPVISTAIKELKNYPDWVVIAQTAEEWSVGIQRLLSQRLSQSERQRQRRFAGSHAWEQKVKQILSLIKPEV